jgi:hypothetical protein
MIDVLLTPAPLILAVLLFSALSWPQIRSMPWAKIGRCLAVVVFLANVGTLLFAASEKAREGRRREDEMRNKKAANQSSDAINAEAAPQHQH